MALAYGLDEPPTAEELAETSEVWRPYRTWVALHLRAALEKETREISGTRRVAGSGRGPGGLPLPRRLA